MFAAINDRGKQYTVREGERVRLDLMDQAPGAEVTFDRVMLVGEGEGVSVGRPNVDGASVTAKVLEEVKGKKLIVFKKKRRKMYRRKQGHRQRYTDVLIEAISGS